MMSRPISETKITAILTISFGQAKRLIGVKGTAILLEF